MNKKPLKILVVDDEDTIRFCMTEILTEHGFEAVCAQNAKEALALVKEHDFKLVFMDMLMPGVGGLEAFRRLKECAPDVKVVLFTGAFRQADKDIFAGIKEGMIDEFIRKPFYPDEIVKTLKKYAA